MNKFGRQTREKQISLAFSKAINGSALAVTMVICGILGLLMGSYLLMVQTQNHSVVRAQGWNGALVVAEAGVEEALAHLNSGVATNALAVNSWSAMPGGVVKTNFLGTSYYASRIYVTNNATPVIIAQGYVPGPLGKPKLARTVRVKTDNKQGMNFPGAMIVTTTVNFNGKGITTDSFISTNALYSSNGLYVASKALDHGDVSTLSSSTNNLRIDNGMVKGSIHTAKGGTLGVTATVNAGGVVGDKPFTGDKNNLGKVQNGHFADDANWVIPDATLPNTGGKFWLPPVPGSYKINGVTYKYLLNSGGYYKLGTLDGGVYVNGPGVNMWVTDAISFGSKDEIRITGNGDMNLYVSAANANLSGGGIINDTGLAKKFMYWGLPTNTALGLSANSAFVGRIYAPQATFTLNGGGNNTYDFIDQSITKSATMGGHFNFHWDEATSIGGATPGYAPVSWDEM